MARPRSIPDAEIFDAILRLMAEGGAAGVSFGTVSKLCGLAPASLVQRYGDRLGMVRAAMAHGWAGVEAVTETLAAREETAQGFLKALGAVLPPALLRESLADAAMAPQAAAWRAGVERVLAAKMGSRAEAAAMLFAAWQGRMLWSVVGGGGFRLKDVVRRLG
ncbi:MAG: transcriptional regulator [Paracoccaceae bacterium]